MEDLDPSDQLVYTEKITYPVELHRQLCIVNTPLTGRQDGPKHVDFRVYNWRRLNSGRVVRGDGWGLVSILFIAVALWVSCEAPSMVWTQQYIGTDKLRALLGLTVLLFAVFNKSRTVLYQSVTPLPGLGLQLSTTRGISLPHPSRPASPDHRFLCPISTSYTFIPLSEISTIVINEGLRRWNVRYYLAVIKKGGKVVVALDEVWAPVSVLKEVYHGVRESLFDEYAGPP